MRPPSDEIADETALLAHDVESPRLGGVGALPSPLPGVNGSGRGGSHCGSLTLIVVLLLTLLGVASFTDHLQRPHVADVSTVPGSGGGAAGAVDSLSGGVVPSGAAGGATDSRGSAAATANADVAIRNATAGADAAVTTTAGDTPATGGPAPPPPPAAPGSPAEPLGGLVATDRECLVGFRASQHLGTRGGYPTPFRVAPPAVPAGGAAAAVAAAATAAVTDEAAAAVAASEQATTSVRAAATPVSRAAAAMAAVDPPADPSCRLVHVSVVSREAAVPPSADAVARLDRLAAFLRTALPAAAARRGAHGGGGGSGSVNGGGGVVGVPPTPPPWVRGWTNPWRADGAAAAAAAGGLTRSGHAAAAALGGRLWGTYGPSLVASAAAAAAAEQSSLGRHGHPPSAPLVRVRASGGDAVLSTATALRDGLAVAAAATRGGGSAGAMVGAVETLPADAFEVLRFTEACAAFVRFAASVAGNRPGADRARLDGLAKALGTTLGVSGVDGQHAAAALDACVAEAANGSATPAAAAAAAAAGAATTTTADGGWCGLLPPAGVLDVERAEEAAAPFFKARAAFPALAQPLVADLLASLNACAAGEGEPAEGKNGTASSRRPCVSLDVRVGSHHTLVPLLTMLRVFRAPHADAPPSMAAGGAGEDANLPHLPTVRHAASATAVAAVPLSVHATADATTSVNVNGCRAYLSTMAPYGANVAVELHRCEAHAPTTAAAAAAAAAAVAPATGRAAAVAGSTASPSPPSPSPTATVITHVVRLRLHERYIPAVAACSGAASCGLGVVRSWLGPVLAADWDAQCAVDRVPTAAAGIGGRGGGGGGVGGRGGIPVHPQRDWGWRWGWWQRRRHAAVATGG
ncbi:hypothetical protein MMPV_002451 [Pyropia vietnamensis]